MVGRRRRGNWLRRPDRPRVWAHRGVSALAEVVIWLGAFVGLGGLFVAGLFIGTVVAHRRLGAYDEPEVTDGEEDIYTEPRDDEQQE